MKRRIIGTFLSRILIAFSSLLVLVITSRELGPEARGTISLLLLAMTITVLTNEIVAGPALIYFFPRVKHSTLLNYAFLWMIVCSLVIPSSLYLFELLPEEYLGWVILIILFQSTSGISMLFQLGTENATRYNILALTQSMINPVVLIFLIYVADIKSIHTWLYSVASAQGLTAFAGLLFIKTSNAVQKQDTEVSLKSLMHYGFMAQLSTLAYILSTRLSYYLLDITETRASVGIFSTGVSIMEAALLFSSSVAIMTYSRISNSEDEDYNVRITSILAKVTFSFTVPLMIILLLVPEKYYLMILGDGFKGMKQVMFFLIPGVAMISMSTIFTHYFSGKAHYKVNVLSSLTGLICSFILGFALIPSFGIIGACITTSMGYLASGLFTILYFRNSHRSRNLSLLPNFSDLRKLLSEIRKI